MRCLADDLRDAIFEESDLAAAGAIAKIRLEQRSGGISDHAGLIRSTPDFDLVLQLPEVDHEGQRTRLAKEIDQLEKLIHDKDAQLSNEKFVNGAPPQVVESLRAKRAEYLAQLEKSRVALSDLR